MGVDLKVAAHSVLYTVETYACRCGDRIGCDECRRYWVRRRVRGSMAFLGGRASHFATMTIPTNESWLEESGELWRRWSLLGRRQSKAKIRGENTLELRGVASMHLVNCNRVFQPHIHAVLDCRSPEWIQTTWKSFGEGFVDVEPIRDVESALAYALAASCRRIRRLAALLVIS